MGSVKKLVKKVARPKVLLPLAAIALGGPALAGAMKGKAAGSALFGKGLASTLPAGATTASGALLPIAKSAVAPTAGLFGAGGTFAPLSGTLAKGIATGLANPFSKAGLATYGTAGLGLAALMGKDKTPEQEKLGVDPQSVYDMGRLYNQKMGGAFTDEELNTALAPLLSQYGGEYQTIVGPERKRRPMFEGLNYSGLTRLAADGGSIIPRRRPKRMAEISSDIQKRIKEMEEFEQSSKGRADDFIEALESSGDQVRQDAYDNYKKRYNEMLEGPLGPSMPPMQSFEEFFSFPTTPGMNEEMIADQMFDMMRRQELNPVGRKDGGLMQLAMSDPDPMAERSDMMENIALDKFGKPLSRLTDDEIIQIEEMIENMMPMANGGSIPQTNNVPNGMQIDGRGGGFIPMGARERKDDVPAMLAKNEFVMTADAVRGMGNGDVNEGAQRMYDLMNNLESKV